ncbi:MAG: hypothetical protein ACI37O_01890 [Candidatus Avelusimicrobium sp.]|uniref:hypothetical protein n=1 Tax=Candidatus Avelusimicrobium sp. TaxID=3048833 RepID=UPI003F0E523D
MRIVLLVSVLFISCSVFAQMYRSGGTRKANFGTQQTEQTGEEEKSSVPGAKSGVKTRTFTSYGARQQWSKGVQTQTVQTSTAGTAAQAPAEETVLPGAEKKLGAAAKKASPAPKAAPAGSAAQQQPAAQAQAAQPAAMPAEAAAAMQQVQGLQDMLKNLGGAAGTGAAAGAPAGAAPAMPAGMNIPGMPDMSALMGAAAAGQQPGKK